MNENFLKINVKNMDIMDIEIWQQNVMLCLKCFAHTGNF